MPGQVYAVASGKGGVGKTTTAVNLGVTLRADGHSVVLIDADLGMPNLADFLGVEPDGTIHDVLAGTAGVEGVVTDIAEGFAVIPGNRDLAGFAHADPDALGAVIEAAAATYDYVIVDTGAGLSYEDVLPLGLVDEVILVTAPDPAAVGDTAKTVELAGLVGGAIAGVVVTRVRDGDDPESIADRLGVALLAAIPFEVAVQESTATGSPLEAHAPESASASAYRALEATLTDGEPSATDPTTGAPDAPSGIVGDAPIGGDADAAGVGAAGDEVDDEPSEDAIVGSDEVEGEDATAGTDEEVTDDSTAETSGDPEDGEDRDTEVDDEPARDDADGADPNDVTGEGDPGSDAADDGSGDAGDEGTRDATADSPDDDAGRTGPFARFLGWFR